MGISILTSSNSVAVVVREGGKATITLALG